MTKNDGTIITFENGLRLAFKKADDGKVKASIDILVMVGSENEGSPKGLAHLLEHSMFKGTKNYSQEQLSVEFDKVSANTNASTSTEFTHFKAKFPKFNVERVFELMSEMLFDSVFEASGLENEKQVIIEEIKMCNDDPSRFAFDKLIESMYSNSPMAYDIAGEVDLLKKVTREELINFRNTHYIPQNIIITVIGDFDVKNIKTLTEKYFKKRFVEINGAEQIVKSYLPNIKRPKNLIINTKGLFQSNVMMGLYIMDALNSDRRKFSLVTFILGGSMSSRLFQKLRNEMSLCYSIYADRYFYKNNGFLLIDFSTSKQNRDIAIEAVKKELQNILDNGITQEEFERAKSVLLNSFLMQQDDPYVNLSYLAYTGKIENAEEVIKELKALEKSECERAFRKFINLDELHISVVE